MLMNEIEKMYENAEVEQIEGQKWVCKNPYHCPYQNLSIVSENCSRCKSFEIEMTYPPFTAEKQINLTQKLWELKPNVYPNFDLLTNYSYSEMIAELANHLWQDLTTEERQQVKEILE